MHCPHTWFSTELKGGKRLLRTRLRGLLRPAPRRGRALAAMAAVLALCAGALVACRSGAGDATAHIVMDTQYYNDRGSILEIPQIAGDDSSDAQAINAALLERKAVYQVYMDDPYQSGTWCEVAAYPVTTERYLNLALLENVYPNYGTDGDLYAWVYDRQERRSVTVEEALDLAGITEDALREAVAEALAAGELPIPLDEDSFSIRGFRIEEGDDVTFYLQGANVDGAEGMDPWLGLYTWNQGNLNRFQETYSTDVDTFVPAELVDVMDPPLWCQWRTMGAPENGFVVTRPLALWSPTAAYLGLDPASLEGTLYDAALNRQRRPLSAPGHGGGQLRGGERHPLPLHPPPDLLLRLSPPAWGQPGRRQRLRRLYRGGRGGRLYRHRRRGRRRRHEPRRLLPKPGRPGGPLRPAGRRL